MRVSVLGRAVVTELEQEAMVGARIIIPGLDGSGEIPAHFAVLLVDLSDTLRLALAQAKWPADGTAL